MNVATETSAINHETICHILTPVGMLGYGFDEQEMHDTLAKLTKDSAPVALILDSGSTDSGPQKLATGSMTCPRSSYERDIGRLLRGVMRYNVPLLIGSAGGAGINAHVDEIGNIVETECQKSGYKLNLLKIYSEISKDLITKRYCDGRISGCGSAVPALKEEDIDQSPLIVAQMGSEPYLQAMAELPDFDVIIGGRAYDPVPYVAFVTNCLRKRKSQDAVATSIDGAMMHAGKIMECGGICATPKSAGAVATIYSDGSFDIVPMLASAKCTPLSVAAHTLYEKSRPDVLHGPGGWLDLTESKYTQQPDGRTVRVYGSTFHASQANDQPYQIKLEAARLKGFRSMYMGCHRDPILTGQIDQLLARVKDYVRSQIDGIDDHMWDLNWHIHGRERGKAPNSLFLVGEAIADTQELATNIIAIARTASIHGSYPGQKATGGNFAFGIGATTEIPLGPCSEFCIYHLMDLEAGEEVSLFPIIAKVIDHSEQSNGTTTNLSATSRSQPEMRRPGPPQARSSNGIYIQDADTLGAAAKVLRSKNSGPFEITLDVMFDCLEVYQVIKESKILTREVISKLYDIKADDVIWSGFFDQALAFKATIPRMRNGIAVASGGYMEDDVHGSQMYIPLMKLILPGDVRKKLQELY